MKISALFFTLFIFNSMNSSRVLTKDSKNQSTPGSLTCLDTTKFEDFVKKTYKKTWDEIRKGQDKKEDGLVFYKDFNLVTIEFAYSESSKQAVADHIVEIQKLLKSTKGDKHFYEYV